VISGILYGLFWCVSPICYIKFLIIKPTRRTNFSNLFLEWNSTCFRTVPLFIITSFILHNGMSYSLWAGSRWNILILLASCQQTYMTLPLLCVQWKTPDDGQRNCPKHVEFHSKNKFEKWMRLVGFIIRKFIMMHCHINVKLLHNLFPVLTTRSMFTEGE